ncbi:MAG TPA: amidohydrolase family protein, partial [Thermoplasmata archaeon]|nr:amidohydrolase family protein [Thermoplasmata archaeon]
LQRQIIHTSDRVGERKVESARKSINALNPEIKVVLHEEMLVAANVERIIAGYDVILDGTDTFETRYILNDAAVAAGIPLDLVTIDAARALGVSSTLGSIEVGKRADLAVVSLRRPHTTPFYPANVISHLVYSSRGSDVQATIVDGRVLMAGGVLRTVDEGTVIERAQETAKELLGA